MDSMKLRMGSVAAVALLCLLAGAARAALGLSEIAAAEGDGPVTVFYPSGGAEQPVERGQFRFAFALEGQPQRGNARLVVISHGSGGSPWVHVDLARSLVAAGFVVAFPEHRANNYRDDSEPGPDSWQRRPAEVSRAIDAVARDARFSSLLNLDRVGVYGMSAGGHTALSMAGGRWSRAGFMRHCDDDLEGDFQFCVGLITRLRGDIFDGLKIWFARRIIRLRFDDDSPHTHSDPRVAAVVAAVPAAADFDMASFTAPPVPLGLITAQQDRWLLPRFHSERVLAACKPCEHIADLPDGGHGALLSPLPPGLSGLIGDLLNDPAGFDRSKLDAVDHKTTAFFQRHLLP